MLAPAARLASTGIAVAALVLLLAGCSSQPPAAGESTPPTTAVAEPTPEPTSAPPAGPTAPPAIPFEIACDALVSPETIYAFNPNLATLPEPVIETGSAMEQVQAELGTVCSWQQGSSMEVLTVGVANLPEETLFRVKNEAIESSNMVPTYGGDEDYFTVADGAGEAMTFVGSYWIVTTSPIYIEPGDAVEILAAAKAAVGS